MCDPEMIACTRPCPCWYESSAVGHSQPAHCCFLIDQRATVHHDLAWRPADQECAPPADLVSEPPC